METLYGSHDEIHCSSPGADLSERVQSLASGVYNEFEIMVNTYGEGVIKNLMPQVVAILESLNQAYRDKQENEVELELLRVEHDNLKIQFEREKQLRKNNEQKYLEVEDVLEEERKISHQKAELQESTIRALQVKVRNTQELLSRHEDREREMKDEYSKLHSKYNELFRSHIDYVERTKLQQSESPIRAKMVASSSAASSKGGTTLVVTSNGSETANCSADIEYIHQFTDNNENNNQNEDSAAMEVVAQHSVPDMVDNQPLSSSNSDDHRCDNNKGETDGILEPTVDVPQPGDTLDLDLASSDLDIINSNSTEQTKRAADIIAIIYTKTTADSSSVDCVADSEEEQAVTSSKGNLLPSETKIKLENKVSETLTLDIMPDDAQIQNCFSSPYGVGISSLQLAEFDEFNDNVALEETKSLSEPEVSCTASMHMSLFEELSKHGTAVLGEVDTGADLTVAGVSAAVESLILENTELLATKNALNIVKDDLIAQIDELSGEVELLKEENVRLQQVAEEKTERVAELEEELKKLKETNGDKQASSNNEPEPQSHFTRIDLMRVLIERNQYKERLMELQEAIRRADMARAAAKESQELVSKPVKKRSTVWGFFSGLLSGDDSTNTSNDWSKKTAVI